MRSCVSLLKERAPASGIDEEIIPIPLFMTQLAARVHRARIEGGEGVRLPRVNLVGENQDG
jgi:hypothetical protein